MAIHKFARLLAAGKEIEQYGDGESARDYTFITDIVEGIVRAADRATGFHVWNLGGSRTMRLADLVRKIADRLGTPARVRRLPVQPGDVDRTWADVSRVRHELDWSATVEIDEGLDRFLDWFRRQSESRSAE
jgi:UDP-glucuronate 4-epimerase